MSNNNPLTSHFALVAETLNKCHEPILISEVMDSVEECNDWLKDAQRTARRLDVPFTIVKSKTAHSALHRCKNGCCDVELNIYEIKFEKV